MPTLKLKHILLLAFIVRLILIPFFSDDFNYWANLTFTSFLVDGYNPWTIVYNDPCLHWINPWRCPPLQLVLTIPAAITNQQTGNYILLLFVIKTPLVLIDMITIFFVYKILRIFSKKGSLRYLLFFAFNPIPIISSSMWGSTDSVPVLFMVISLFYFLKATDSSTIERKVSAFFLGLATAAKFYPVIFIPVFLLKIKKTKERIVFGILALLPITIFSIPFLIWDFESYLGILLFHNVGGFHPFFIFLSPNLNAGLKFLATFFSILMLGIAYARKTNILVNIVLTFFALYSLMGFGYFDVKYFLWFIPFAVVLSSVKKVRIRGQDFLPFVYAPSLVHFLIYNGPYNPVEGRTGFFYFTYHWLRQKIVVFQVLPYSELVQEITGLISTALILYYFWTITVKASSFGFHIRSAEELEIIQSVRKTNKLFSVLFVITLISLIVSTNMVPYEANVIGVNLTDSTLHFYDDFSRSILNYQWSCIGSGTYIIKSEEHPSCISLNGNLALYRGWGPNWQGFQRSTKAHIKLRYRLDEDPRNADKTPIINTNGGWFGLITENETQKFTYFDEKTKISHLIAPVDKKWHILQIEYHNNGRLIRFDGNLSAFLSHKDFNYLCLGVPVDSKIEMQGGSFSVDYIEVTVEDFNTGIFGKTYTFLALFIPSMFVVYILFLFSRRIQLSAHPMKAEEKINTQRERNC